MKTKLALLITWLLIAAALVYPWLAFDMQVTTIFHPGMYVFEDGSFSLVRVTGCIPGMMCN